MPPELHEKIWVISREARHFQSLDINLSLFKQSVLLDVYLKRYRILAWDQKAFHGYLISVGNVNYRILSNRYG